ncbi:MAG: GNAT family N-acetyltransferase [Calditrichia bacterium]
MPEYPHFIIRKAEENDIPQLFALVKKLADYERLSDEVTADADLYRRHGFGEQKRFNSLLVENKNQDEERYLGFAIYFFTFSSFTGRPSLYLEDVFVLPDYRGKGIGKAVLRHLAGIALQENCARMEWSVLDWNEPAIRFYKNMGARPMDEWTVYRLTVPEIRRLAEG